MGALWNIRSDRGIYQAGRIRGLGEHGSDDIGGQIRISPYLSNALCFPATHERSDVLLPLPSSASRL